MRILLLRPDADADAIAQALAAHPDAELIGAVSSAAEAERLIAALPRGAEFWARSQGRYTRVCEAELDWVEAERDYVRLHTAGASFLHHEPLGAVAARLDRHAFRRVHRSAIVRWDRAREIRRRPDGLTVVTGLGAQVRIGRSYAPALLAALG
ncbi:LytTR family transcriptional regulator [Sphingomonas sp. LB-2]|nr:LytTR family transcriptional regulator [Sphingomonas caeni]